MTIKYSRERQKLLNSAAGVPCLLGAYRPGPAARPPIRTAAGRPTRAIGRPVLGRVGEDASHD